MVSSTSIPDRTILILNIFTGILSISLLFIIFGLILTDVLTFIGIISFLYKFYFISIIYLSYVVYKKTHASVQLLSKMDGNISCNIRSITQIKVKITVLVCVTAISTIICVLFAIIDGIINSSVTDNTALLLVGIDSIINIICLMLQFEFLGIIYVKCCFICHKKLDNTATKKELTDLAVTNVIKTNVKRIESTDVL